MNTTTSSRPTIEATATGRRRPLRHYVEMVVAMFVGMAVAGGAIRGVLLEHVLMLPLMYVVMLHRRHEYEAPDHV